MKHISWILFFCSSLLIAGCDCGDTDPIDNQPEFPITIYKTGRLASMQLPPDYITIINNGDGNQSGILPDIVTESYKVFDDVFDFIIFTINQSRHQVEEIAFLGLYSPVKNDVQGIGIRQFDAKAMFGSRGSLQGVITLFLRDGIQTGPVLHEIMHRWANHIIETGEPDSHWGFSSSGGGQLGGFAESTLENLGNGLYKADADCSKDEGFSAGADLPFTLTGNCGYLTPYSEIELYLMGLLEAEQVPPLKVAQNAEWYDYFEGIFSADGFDEYTIDDIIAMHGERIPPVADSQKEFRAVNIVLTVEPLTATEWQEYDRYVRDFSLDGDVPYLVNFWEATRGMATIKMDDLHLVSDNSTTTPLPQTTTTTITVSEDAFTVLADIENSMVALPGGTFEMGCSEGDDECLEDEYPRHTVTLSPFQIAAYEITQGQWESMMGSNPSAFSECGADCPVESVYWYEVEEFIDAVNRLSGNQYRLCTEAEWEYAARAGTTTKYNCGDSADCLNEHEWYFNNSLDTPQPVGSLESNPWGLYDMLGNISEWCLDWYSPDYYAVSPDRDPQGPDSGISRAVRGGSYMRYPPYNNVRSSSRNNGYPWYNDAFLVYRKISIGVRLCHD